MQNTYIQPIFEMTQRVDERLMRKKLADIIRVAGMTLLERGIPSRLDGGTGAYLRHVRGDMMYLARALAAEGLLQDVAKDVVVMAINTIHHHALRHTTRHQLGHALPRAVAHGMVECILYTLVHAVAEYVMADNEYKLLAESKHADFEAVKRVFAGVLYTLRHSGVVGGDDDALETAIISVVEKLTGSLPSSSSSVPRAHSLPIHSGDQHESLPDRYPIKDTHFYARPQPTVEELLEASSSQDTQMIRGDDIHVPPRRSQSLLHGVLATKFE